MFSTEWMNNCPMTYPDWDTQTHIVHSVSDHPEGPYKNVDEAVPAAAGNPVIIQAQDGTYLLYFTNYRYTGPYKNCTSG